jgi:hypothetical protein
MWSVFDYASISTAETATKPSFDRPLAEANQYKIPDSALQQPSSQLLFTGNSGDNFGKSLLANDLSQPSGAPPSGADSTLFDPEAFSDLPEEWILDDWTLFGAPLSAYHSGFDF